MRLTEMIELGIKYSILGIFAALIICIFMFIWFRVHKNNVKYTKKYCIQKISLCAIFVCYITVLFGVTMIDRDAVYGNMTSFQLFGSYREAWNSFSLIEWRNLLLNIGLFMPFGFLLPMLFERCKSNWITYLVGFCISLLIELIQLLFGLGAFEVDDILNNTLGAMIGFGIYILIFATIKKTRKVSCIMLSQLPLFFVIVVFISIFAIYNHQEFGNLKEDYSYRVNMDNVVLSGKTKFSSENKTVSTYKMEIGTQEKTLKVANDILKCVGSEVDEGKKDVYEETIIYSSKDGRYSVWVDYKGLTTHYMDYVENNKDVKTGCSEQEVREALKNYNIDIPDKAVFEEDENGRYTFSVSMYLEGDVLLNGVVSCTYHQNNKVSEIYNNLITYQKYRDINIISEQEAYEKLKAGKFKNGNIECQDIEIQSVELSYIADSKGYYQPVYVFKCKKNEIEDMIIIPTI